MKKILLTLGAIFALSACQTTSNTGLRDGDVMGTNIGSILSEEAGLRLSSSEEAQMNSEIEKALYFSKNGLTTRWYAGYNARMRPVRDEPNRRDRECRRFRHGHQIDGQWHNATAIACREYNVAWYLIANDWDKAPNSNTDTHIDRARKPRNGDRLRGDGQRNRQGQGSWENLSDTLSGRPANDDFSRETW